MENPFILNYGKEPISLIERDEKFLNSAIVIEEILKVLTKKNIRVLLCIDEVSNSESMRKLASNFQLWIRHNLDVFLLMTGVYENIENLLNDKVLTFLFRTPRIDLNMLNINIIADSYSKVLNIDFEKAEELANITRGYAFAYQVVGYYAYEQHSSNFLEFSSKVDSALLNGVYRKLWIDCKNNEKNILKAVAYEKNNNKEISDFTKIKINNLPKYKNKLISKKIISLNGSLIELTLPRFKEIILKGELK